MPKLDKSTVLILEIIVEMETHPDPKFTELVFKNADWVVCIEMMKPQTKAYVWTPTRGVTQTSQLDQD